MRRLPPVLTLQPPLTAFLHKMVTGGTFVLIGCLSFFILMLMTYTAPPTSTTLSKVLHHEIGAVSEALPSFRLTVGAHRGSSVTHLENTLAALKAAENDPSYAFVEFDVQYTEDKEIVVFHDQRMLRLFGRLDAIGQTSYADLVELSGGEISLYREAIDLLKKKVNIEIKSQGDQEEDERLVDEIIADLHKRGRAKEVMISSISSDVVRYIADTYPDIRTGQIFWLTWSTYMHLDVLTERLYQKIKDSEADYILLHVANLRNIEGLLKLKPPAKTIMFWDFDDRMYLVHKNITDRLWGSAVSGEIWSYVCFNLVELLR